MSNDLRSWFYKSSERRRECVKMTDADDDKALDVVYSFERGFVDVAVLTTKFVMLKANLLKIEMLTIFQRILQC
ncbi:hypothetical protein E3N88_29547 [Mikania micrantha]|uniref:Uncharacterized protein n=1 Tax=Mikania micrantha TaxID=192012 RepID=A0A5N6MM00_9ASTR|nr:hypothetical protein E3N88_29547 [Mikania micrantha]